MKRIMVLVILTVFQCKYSYSQESASVPKHVIENTRYLVGEWTADVELAGKKRKVHMAVKSMPGEVGYVIHWRGPGGPGKPNTQLTAIGGWDAGSGLLKETGFGTNGDYFSFHYKRTSESTFEGEGSGIYLGKPMKEKVSVERKGRDKFIWKASSIQVGGEAIPDEVFHFQRRADEIESWMKYFVGQWSRETKVWTEADGWKTTSETWECAPTAGGNATVSKGRTSAGVEWTGMEARYGTAATIEQVAASDGGSWTILWNEIDTNRASGSLAGYVPSGIKGEGKASIDRKEKTYVAKWEIKLADGSIMKGIETNTRK